MIAFAGINLVWLVWTWLGVQGDFFSVPPLVDQFGELLDFVWFLCGEILFFMRVGGQVVEFDRFFFFVGED